MLDPAATAAPGFNFAYLKGAFLRNILLVVFTSVLFAAPVLYLGLTAPELYECKASVWVHRTRALVQTSTLEAPEPSQQMLIAFMNSRDIRLKVANELKLKTEKALWGEETEPAEHTDGEILDVLEGMITVEEVRSKPIVEVTVQAHTADLAYKLTDKLMRAAIAKAKSLENEEYQQLEVDYKERKAEFLKAVQDLVDFQTKHAVVTDLQKQGETFFQSALNLRENLIKTESELAGVSLMLEGPADVKAQLELLARKDGLDGAATYLREQDAQLDDAMKEYPFLGGEYTKYQAEVIEKQEILKHAALSREEAKLAATRENPKIIIVDKPMKPEKPISEIFAKVILAAVFGWVVGLALACIHETLRSMSRKPTSV